MLPDRIWLGLRRPVLRGYAEVLGLEITEKAPGRLEVRRVENERRYRKHLLDTRGLGIRGMRLNGDDLLLLVGPRCPWKDRLSCCAGATRLTTTPPASSSRTALRRSQSCPTACTPTIPRALSLAGGSPRDCSSSMTPWLRSGRIRLASPCAPT